MRILHVIPSLGPLYGGPSKLVPEFAGAMNKIGVTVHIATTNANGHQNLDVPLGVPVIHGGATTYYFMRQFPKGYTFSWPLTQWLWRHINDYDLIHVQTIFSYSTAAACRISRHYGKPYVITPHGMLDPWALRYKKWKKRGYLQLMERRNLIGAKALHALTKNELNNFRRIGLNGPIFVAPNGLHASTYDLLPPRSVFEDRFPESKGKKIILYLGRIDPKKGLDILVRAVAAINRNDAYLVIAGPDLIGYRRSVEDLVHKEKISAQVLFTGMLSGKEKQSALGAADLFVLPSYSEGFPIAVLEAMASGLPVIISEGCNFPEVEEVGAGKIIPPEIGHLARVILNILDNPQMVNEMGKRGRSLVLKEYSWEAVANRIKEVYDDIINGNIKSKGWGSSE